jgi:uncharacterized protein (DUF1501 family)
MESLSAAIGCRSLSHFPRRTLLKAGAAAWLTPLATQLARAQEQQPNEKAKSVILVWLEGGPSQLETFDPHPGTKIGGLVQAIPTSAKGVQIASTLPQTAEQMHRVALVRSVMGKEGDHERAIYNVKTGYRPDPTVLHPAIGAITCHVLEGGADIPRHISIIPGSQPGKGGYLGAKYDAFIIGVEASVPKECFRRRIDDLLEVVESEFHRGRLADVDQQRTLHGVATQSAVTMMDSSQLKAFDIQQESIELRQKFGDTASGRACLAAVRLIEAGVRCVEVTISGGWDSHVNNHELQSNACGLLDPAYAALLQTLADRDLLDSTLVLCGGEFGRTPQINPLEGRDHWPHGFSIALAGTGIRGGAVHGATSPTPRLEDRFEENVDSPVTVADVHATAMEALGIPFHDEHMTPIGRPLRWSDGTPIRSLLS